MRRIRLQKTWKEISASETPERQILFLRESLLLSRTNPTRLTGLWVALYVFVWVFRVNGLMFFSWSLLLVIMFGVGFTTIVFLRRYNAFLNRWGGV